MANTQSTKLALLEAKYLGRRRGVSFQARFACGHIGTGVFPHATARTSRATIIRWLFGTNNQECCSRACRERAEQP